MSLASIYLQNAVNEFQVQKTLGFKTLEQIPGELLHWQPNEECNSIAVLMQHLHGNMLSRWTNFLTEDGEKTWRKRDEEFIDRQFPREELMRLWEEGWSTLFNSLNNLNDDDLLKEITIREQKLSVVSAINRQLTHYAYHIGQIVYLGKTIKGTDWKTLSIPRKHRV